MKDILVGVDIGTTNTKLSLVDFEGNNIYSSSVEHNVYRPQEGYAEHDAQKVWYGEMKQLLERMFSETGVLKEQIAAIGISAIYPVIVPTDEHGNALRNAILYGIDTRTVKEIEYLKSALGDDYSIKLTGNAFNSQSIAPKIFWLRNNEPEIFNKTRYFMSATSYVIYQLTGECVLDHGTACLCGLPYNLEDECWDARTCEFIGITIDQMPVLKYGSEIAGTVTAQAAKELGLVEGIPVITGTGDHIAEVFAVGGIQNGMALISYGTTFGMDLCTDIVKFYPGLQMSRTCFADMYLTGGGMANGGSVTRWFRDAIADGADFETLNQWAKSIAPGCDGLLALPYFNGERCPFYDPYAAGAFYGLRLNHTKQHIYRALMESVAFGIRHVMETLKDAGFSNTGIIAVGGGTKSDIWLQIISDVCQVTQKVPAQSRDSSYGSAVLAGLAVGVDIPKCRTQSFKEIHPNPANKEIYDKRYKEFRALYKAMGDMTNKNN